MLDDPTFQGRGEFVAAVTGDEEGCTVSFDAGDAALPALGVSTDCPPQASILLAFTRTENSWTLDREDSVRLDNGECRLTFAGPQPSIPR